MWLITYQQFYWSLSPGSNCVRHSGGPDSAARAIGSSAGLLRSHKLEAQIIGCGVISLRYFQICLGALVKARQKLHKSSVGVHAHTSGRQIVRDRVPHEGRLGAT